MKLLLCVQAAWPNDERGVGENAECCEKSVRSCHWQTQVCMTLYDQEVHVLGIALCMQNIRRNACAHMYNVFTCIFREDFNVLELYM